MGSFSPRALLQIARSLGPRCLLARLNYSIRQQLSQICEQPNPAERRRIRSVISAVFRRRSEPVADEALGELIFHQVRDQSVYLRCRNGALHLEILADDLLRIRLHPATPDGSALSPAHPPFSYALDPEVEWPPVTFDVETGAEGLTIRTGQLSCFVEQLTCRLTFADGEGNLLSGAAEGLGFRGRGVFCTRRLVQGEAIYGLGEKAYDLNLRGRRLEMWNTDPAVYAPGDDPINLNIPMFVGLREGRAYGFFFDNPGRARFDLGQAQANCLRYEADTGELCTYFFAGPTIPAVLECYTQLTGHMPLPPRWALDYHQSRWSYESEREVRELAGEFRRRHIPCDVIHMDIHYMDGYRIFTWDHDRFPDPPRLLADLRELGFRAISIIDPGVKVDPGYHVHDDGLARGAFCKLPEGQPFRGPVWPGECYFPDFTAPQTRDWWGDLYHPLLDAGLAGFWNDMNEPAIFGGEMPGNVAHNYEGRGAPHSEIHNVYGLQMARASTEGLGHLRPNERVPLISRSGYAGLQRYALVWTGDNQSTWAQLRLGVSMCLNLGLCGVAFCGPDTGGFAGECDGELLTRWTQVGAMTPFFRNHSALGTARQEPWSFGEPYESICRRWIELRYELLPYIYTSAWQATRTGLPMMRPLALAFPNDIRTYSLDDQFLLGDALMAAPVSRPGQTSRRVYLPGGPWYDFWSSERAAGEVTAEAPLERMPLYVRAGSVLPRGPAMQHSGEWPPKSLQLDIYPGDGESWLYEDDGHSLSYQVGEFQVTRFVSKAHGGNLDVHRQVEGSFDPGYAQFEITIHGLETAPRQVLLDGQPIDVDFDAGKGNARLTSGPWTRLQVL